MDESDFENSATPAQTDRSPSNKMRTPSDSVKIPELKPSASKGLSGKEATPRVPCVSSSEAVGGQTVVVHGNTSKNTPTELKLNNNLSDDKAMVVPEKKERDRINNLAQKERRLEEVGVTRKKAYQVIADALEAEIVSEIVVNGVTVEVRKPDFDKRKWAVEKALIMFGDAIERKEVEYDIGDKTLEKYKSLSVDQMKARMAELVLGKPVSRLPVIDV